MKKVWKSALLAVLVVSSLGSCGSGESEPEPSEKSGQARAIEFDNHYEELKRRKAETETHYRASSDLMNSGDFIEAKEEMDKYTQALLDVDEWHQNWEKEFSKKLFKE